MYQVRRDSGGQPMGLLKQVVQTPTKACSGRGERRGRGGRETKETKETKEYEERVEEMAAEHRQAKERERREDLSWVPTGGSATGRCRAARINHLSAHIRAIRNKF